MNPIFHSSSSSSRTYKVILVFEAAWPASEGGYEVFSIDVHPRSDGGQRTRPRVLTNPLFRLPKTYPRFMISFAFDSKIYFTGGYPASMNSERPRDVFVYDTSSPGTGIQKAGRMNFGKDSPSLIGPVNGKFYLISICLSYHDFEVFDPKRGTWCPLEQPPVPRVSFPTRVGHTMIGAHAIVGNRIFLFTEPFASSSIVFSYHIVKCKWSRFRNVYLPFHVGGVPLSDDRYLAFNRGTLEFGTFHYNKSEKVWNDFQCIQKPAKIIAYDRMTFLFSLGDGLFCGVLSGKDCSEFEYDYTDVKPGKHYISMVVSGAQPNEVGPLFSRVYEDPCDMKKITRFLISAFPLDASHHLESEAEHLEASAAHLDETSKRKRSDG